MNENNVTTNNMLDVRQPFDSKAMIANIKSQILMGHINPLEGWVVVKRMAKIGEEVLEDPELRELAIKEFSKYTPPKGKKTVDVFSANISHSAVHTFYDFTGCKHEALDELYKIRDQVKYSIGVIEEELKLLIPSESKQAEIFKIENTATDKIVPKLPRLIWEDSAGLVCSCEPPKKVQKMGLKFMKI